MRIARYFVVFVFLGCAGDRLCPDVEYEALAGIGPLISVSAYVIGSTEHELVLKELLQEVLDRYPNGFVAGNELVIPHAPFERMKITYRKHSIALSLNGISAEERRLLSDSKKSQVELFEKIRDELFRLSLNTVQRRHQMEFNKDPATGSALPASQE